MAIRLDEKEEKQPKIEELKRQFEMARTMASAFMNSYKTMDLKERTRKYQEITQTFNRLETLANQIKAGFTASSGAKFSFENYRQSYSSFMQRWRKFEESYLGLPNK